MFYNFPKINIYLLQIVVLCAAQINTPEYNQAMYNAKREIHFAQLLELSKLGSDVDLLDLASRMILRILEVLNKSKVDLEEGQLAETVKVPDDPKMGNAYALILENSPLLADLILRFPDTAHELLSVKKNKVELELINWAFTFSKNSKFPPERDLKLFQLAEQELNIVSRPGNYRNPFSDELQREQLELLRKAERTKIRKEKMKKMRRPKLTQHSEL